MTHEWPTPMAWPMAYPNGVAGCYGTERDETERENHQDPEEFPSVHDRSGAVDNSEFTRLEDALALAIDGIGRLFDGSYPRMAVQNHEPRPPSEANVALRAALLRRDSGCCWMCGRDSNILRYWGHDSRMVIEHLVPRSAFTPATIADADRSDNLRIACWACNTAKSNRAVPFREALPIVWACPTDLLEQGAALLFDVDETHRAAWCDFCQAATVVPPQWPIARLTWSEVA